MNKKELSQDWDAYTSKRKEVAEELSKSKDAPTNPHYLNAEIHNKTIAELGWENRNLDHCI